MRNDTCRSNAVSSNPRFPAKALCLGILAAVAVACSANADGADDSAQDITTATPGGDAAVIVTDPTTLQDLEQRGLSFATVVGGTGSSGKELLASSIYKGIVDTVTGDIADIQSLDPGSIVGFGQSFASHRLFDVAWFQSAESRFELVGVTNRLDMRTSTDCGQLRLIYRMAYSATKTSSRLPIEVNVIMPQPSDGQGCATIANKWLAVQPGSASSLLEGPLKDRPPVKFLEINYQATRWATDARPDMGGEIEYVLRSFTVDGGKIAPNVLRNTPRTDLSSDERDALRQWITDNLAAIDDGGAVLPDKFLASKARSVGTFGDMRLANRPYSQIFADPKSAFSSLPLGNTKQLKSVAALMRRLDTMSCQGCHQQRSVAGFHLPGEERTKDTFNTLAVGRSNHLTGILDWRFENLRAIAEGRPLGVPMPFAEHGSKEGGMGTHCGLGDPGFASWTCNEGLHCEDPHGDIVGVCSPAGRPVGAVCQVGPVTLDADPHKDARPNRQDLACDPGNTCRNTGSFPDGLCAGDCSAQKPGTITGSVICATLPNKALNQKCLEQDRRPFPECARDPSIVKPNAIQRCNADMPCRDDFSCMRVDSAPPDEGGCVPPYFGFQMRVDGHMFDDIGH
jgi:hypothetical protein